MFRFLSLITAVLFTLQVFAGSLGNINETYWHDGFAFFHVKEKKGVLLFTGGTLHEGGYDFKVVKGRGGKMVLKSSYENLGLIPLSGRSVPGSTIERKMIDGKDVLVITSPGGKVTDVLLKINKNENFETLLEQQINDQLDGIYSNSEGGYVSFNGKGSISMGSSQNNWEKYKFLYIYESPSNIIETLGGKHYQFDFDSQNIKFEEVKTVDGVAWDDDPAVEAIKTMTLKKIQGVNYAGDGLWPITSEKILPAGYLSCYDAESLRLMRNDIYARHGYQFKDNNLRKIFSNQSWYKPVTSNASSLKLNQVEQINIALIQNMEKVKSQED